MKDDLTHNTLKYLWNKKAWWLAPILIMLLIVSVLIIIGSNSVLSPFIYALF